jgi:hypothetical protein
MHLAINPKVISGKSKESDAAQYKAQRQQQTKTELSPAHDLRPYAEDILRQLTMHLAINPKVISGKCKKLDAAQYKVQRQQQTKTELSPAHD